MPNIELTVTEDSPIELNVPSDSLVRLGVNEQIINSGGGGMSDDVKQALLDLIEHLAFIDADGQDYYDALYAALYPPTELDYITAVYTQSGTVYETDSLDDLKPDLVVTAHNDDGTTEVVTTYTLSGALTAGTSVITVSYGGKTTTFNVTVTEAVHLSSITAVYTQSGTVYDTDSLESLKADLVVTAVYSDSTTETVPSADYTLSGTLTVGTSTITVSYGGKSTNFNVEVVHDSTVQIATEGAFLAHYKSGAQDIYEEKTKTNTGVTIKYQMDSPTTKLNPAGIIPSDAPSTLYKDNCYACLFVYDASQNPFNFVNELSNNTFNRWVQNAAGTMTEYSNSWNLAAPFSYIAFSVDMRYIDDAYMYDKTTGQVWFAGINTPYYGMSNISEAQS